jgi:phosphoglycolate phosphatase-like HAD superfamily hydrolase
VKSTLIFDFDGTLVDTFPIYKEYCATLTGRYTRKTIDAEDIREKGIKLFIKESGVPFWKVPFLIGELKKMYETRIPVEADMFIGIPEVIKKLSCTYILGIVSSNSEKTINAFFREKNLINSFSFIIGGSSLFGKYRKLLDICKRNNINPEKSYYISDEDRDIDAAKKAKLNTIAVTWGFNSEKLLILRNPDYIVKCPNDLCRILLKK